MLELLRADLAAFRQYADAAEDVVWMTNDAGDVVYINAAWTRLTGQSTREAEGQGWRQALHREDRDVALSTLVNATRDLKTFRVEYRIADGSTYRWTLASGWPYFNSLGRCELYLGTVRPVRVREGVAMEVGTSSLTKRECEVLEWLAAGKTAYEIGVILGISRRTVEEHVKNATFKTGATNSTQAVVEAIRKGAIVV